MPRPVRTNVVCSCVSSGTATPSASDVGHGAPAAALTTNGSVVTTAAQSAENVDRSCSSTTGSGSLSPTSEPVARASASASARARRASRDRRALRSTRVLTVTATATKTTRAVTFSASWTENVCSGGTKNQFVRPNAAIALATPGRMPPSAPMPTTLARKSKRTVDKLRSSRNLDNTKASNGRTMPATSQAPCWRRGATAVR